MITAKPSKYDMRSIAPTITRIFNTRDTSSTECECIQEIVTSLDSIQQLVVVIIDSFGISTWQHSKHQTPTFNAIAEKHLISLKAVTPTITPVNFATMLTGAHPLNHQITDRTQSLRLETLFHVLRENDKTSATAARTRSTLGLLISPFADYPLLAESNTDQEVLEFAIQLLHKQVNLLWIQFLDVDDTSHSFGPYSKENIKASGVIDSYLRTICETAYITNYGLIVAADHGHHNVSDKTGQHIGKHGTGMKEDTDVPVVWCTHSELPNILVS